MIQAGAEPTSTWKKRKETQETVRKLCFFKHLIAKFLIHKKNVTSTPPIIVCCILGKQIGQMLQHK